MSDNEIFHENDYYFVFNDGTIMQALTDDNYDELSLDEAQAMRNALSDAIMAQIELI